jgi:hypothetical protein
MNNSEAISLHHPVANLRRCTPGDKQMLPAHKRRQSSRKIFRYICDIVQGPHALTAIFFFDMFIQSIQLVWQSYRYFCLSFCELSYGQQSS